MKFTVTFFAVLTITSTWAVTEKKREEAKGKRESPPAVYESVGPPTHSLQGSSIGQEGGNAISIGAGYSFGSGSPQYNFDQGQGQGQDIQLQFAQESQPSRHANLQLSPITLQPGQGMDDLAQIMSQITHGLNTGAISLQSLESPNSFDASSYQSLQQGQTPHLSFGQYSFEGLKPQKQYSVTEQSNDGGAPSFSSSPKDVSAFSSSGPVLFNPAGESQQKQPALTYNTPSSLHSFGQGKHVSFGGHPSLNLFGSSLGGSGSLFGNGGHTGAQALSFANPGPALSLKGFGGRYTLPSKSAFKPSAYLGSSVRGDSNHGLSEQIPTFSGPHLNSNNDGHSLGSGAYSAGFGGFGGGSSKYISPLQFPSKLAFAALSSKDHFSSPPGTTYGSSVGSHGFGSASHSSHSASSHTPLYVRPSKHVSAFGEGSSSFQGPSGHVRSLMSSHSGPKYSFAPSSRFGGIKDVEGAYSDSTYNTIKYSEDLKPHVM